MAILLILLAFLLFLVGMLTPINSFYTLPISFVFLIFGIAILLKRKEY
ncbi:hypothetical protein GH741_12385 [Aquibacillus halophilus]|uniref:Uncharacterized protein n=1 Tax=Aquibacillus halophilus TaxID=930132 RepID=A0A6A8DFZ9_9BACI|nr:hypothetical protein [Aquibacillus halophilus]MRH43476.1 hypothetical protein [Aquibacillus halophilus]